jgi:hypothetical protein
MNHYTQVFSSFISYSRTQLSLLSSVPYELRTTAVNELSRDTQVTKKTKEVNVGEEREGAESHVVAIGPNVRRRATSTRRDAERVRADVRPARARSNEATSGSDYGRVPRALLRDRFAFSGGESVLRDRFARALSPSARRGVVSLPVPSRGASSKKTTNLVDFDFRKLTNLVDFASFSPSLTGSLPLLRRHLAFVVRLPRLATRAAISGSATALHTSCHLIVACPSARQMQAGRGRGD